MRTEESITITDRIAKSEDHMNRTDHFSDSFEAIAKLDDMLNKLVKQFGSEGGSKGKAIESIEEAADKQLTQNQLALLDAEDSIRLFVTRFDEQIEEMKTQKMTLTYIDQGGFAK